MGTKSDFLLAITQLSAEKNLPKEVVLAAVEAALASAYKKENFAPNQNVAVKIDPVTGKVRVWVEKTVVSEPTDVHYEISLEDARRIKAEVQIGETLQIEATPSNAGRIAAQTAKQVILQRLHEAEHSAIFEEYAHKEGDIITGIVQRIEPKQIYIDLGRTEAILPSTEQVRIERYRVGQRLKVYLLEVARTSKGPQVVVSRSHRDLVRRLFELEVPEVFNGIVEIKSIAREAGFRSKVAVTARQEGVDPVGCCVGLRGIRIQNIISELNGEKIDIVLWGPDPAVFVANALSPAKVVSVELNPGDGVATVVVPDKLLSLAIGKEGQNARLAAKLTGWKIDIKSASAVEAERAEQAKLVTEVVAEAVHVEEPVAVAEEPIAEIPPVKEPALVSVETTQAETVEVVEPSPVVETPLVPPTITLEMPAEVKRQLRFAEDILAPAPASPAKSKKKKRKGARGKGEAEGVRFKKQRPDLELLDEEGEY